MSITQKFYDSMASHYDKLFNVTASDKYPDGRQQTIKERGLCRV